MRAAQSGHAATEAPITQPQCPTNRQLWTDVPTASITKPQHLAIDCPKTDQGTEYDPPPPAQTRADRVLACCLPCVSLPRRRSVCCLILTLWLLWLVGGCAFAVVLLVKLKADLDFVLCDISACVPGDPVCNPCRSADDNCTLPLEEYSTRTQALPLNISYVVYNPIFIGATVERLVTLMSLDPLPPLSAAEMLALDPLDAHAMGIPVACESGHARYSSGWGDELSMVCYANQGDTGFIGRLAAAQQGANGESFHVRVAVRTKLPVVGWRLQIAQDASQYADSFNFANPHQPPDGLAACSGPVSGVKYGVPENVLALYDFDNYKVSICAPEHGELGDLVLGTTASLVCIAAPFLPSCGGASVQEPLRLTIPIEMHNSAGFNLTLDINGSATVVYDDEGEYISSGYLHETTTIPPRSSKIVHYYSDINEFLTRYSRESGLLSLTSHAIDKVLRSAVALDIVSSATILGSTYEQSFTLTHTSLIELISLSGCRCLIGPDSGECHANASQYAKDWLPF